MTGLRIRVELEATVVDFGPFYMAYDRLTGLAGFAETQDEALYRLRRAFDLTLETLGPGEGARAYLSSRGLRHTAHEVLVGENAASASLGEDMMVENPDALNLHEQVYSSVSHSARVLAGVS